MSLNPQQSETPQSSSFLAQQTTGGHGGPPPPHRPAAKVAVHPKRPSGQGREGPSDVGQARGSELGNLYRDVDAERSEGLLFWSGGVWKWRGGRGKWEGTAGLFSG